MGAKRRPISKIYGHVEQPPRDPDFRFGISSGMGADNKPLHDISKIVQNDYWKEYITSVIHRRTQEALAHENLQKHRRDTLRGATKA